MHFVKKSHIYDVAIPLKTSLRALYQETSLIRSWTAWAEVGILSPAPFRKLEKTPPKLRDK